MVHSVEVVFDPDTEDAVRRIWADLAGAGVPSQAPASRPHATLAVAERIAPDVDALLAPVVARLPLPCRIGGVILFGRSQWVLARLVVPSADLLRVHADVFGACLPHLSPAPKPNTRPDQWTAHVTLARRVGPAVLGRALRIAGRPAELDGAIVGLRRWDGNSKREYPIG